MAGTESPATAVIQITSFETRSSRLVTTRPRIELTVKSDFAGSWCNGERHELSFISSWRWQHGGVPFLACQMRTNLPRLESQ